jgi:hypothetical protein
VLDDSYLAGGDKQLYLDPKNMEMLKKHGFVSERKPINFKDYDPNAVNTDGSKATSCPAATSSSRTCPWIRPCCVPMRKASHEYDRKPAA